MDSARGRFPHPGRFARIQDGHGLSEFGPRPHQTCNDRLAPLTFKMGTRGAPLDGTVKSSCSKLIVPAYRASSDRRREAVESSTASHRQPRRWTTSYLRRR